MTLLLKIKDDVIKYAETISQILNVDVEVMDNNFVRIAGTGRLKEKIGINMAKEAYIYKEVLKTKETYIITAPRKEEICFNCPSRGTCGEVLEISTPIFLEMKLLGLLDLFVLMKSKKMSFYLRKIHI